MKMKIDEYDVITIELDYEYAIDAIEQIAKELRNSDRHTCESITVELYGKVISEDENE